MCAGSAEILADLGIPWVILGHSERRALIGESSEVRHLSSHIPLIIRSLCVDHDNEAAISSCTQHCAA